MSFLRARPKPAHPVVFYRYSWQRRVMKALLVSGAALFIGFLFYDTIWVGITLGLIGSAAALRGSNGFVLARKKLLSVQFEQALQSVSSSLHAGKSMENALRFAAEDLRMMYSQQSPYMAEELERIIRMVEHGIALELALDELAARLEIPDITDWVNVFKTCRRTGGDLLAVMRNTSRAISEKMDLERELSIMIAGKRFEANLLSVVPFGILAALRFGSPDYMAPLYEGMGRVVMTSALLVFAGSIFLAGRFMRFEW